MVAAVEEEALEIVELLVHLAARDRDGRDGAQAPQALVIVTGKRLLQPFHPVLGQGLRRPERPVVVPVRTEQRGVVDVGLVGVHHDGHAVADGVPDGPDLGDVLRQRLAVDAQLDGAVALVLEAAAIVGPLGGRPVLPGGGVGGNLVPGVAQELVDGETRHLAENVPEC